LTLGFLTVLHEANGYLGGYLVTNQWGRPLEFRLSTAVQPNRVQQILYGGALEPYICADLIGKTLVEKTGLPVQLVVTDTAASLDLRLRLEAPVALLPAADRPGTASGTVVEGPARGRPSLQCHPQFPGDAAAVREMLERLGPSLDLTEPFQRIREAMGEARKMGVTNR
jgi:hypothetical protein